MTDDATRNGTPASEFIEIAWRGEAVRIEHAWIPGPRQGGPLIVFLHEGLGCLRQWRDLPWRLCEAAGARGLVWSRPGYGRSTPRARGESWGHRYLHEQALEVMPAFFEALGLDTVRDPPWLLGHSDGGSIALLHGALSPTRVAGVVVLAPHILVEPRTLEGVEAARHAYLHGNLRARLATLHDDPDGAFFGWNDVWRDPSFRDWSIENELPSITAPVRAVQGLQDAYGGTAQVRGIAQRVPGTRVLEWPDCGHVPQREHPQRLIDAVRTYIQEQIRPL